MRKKKTQEGREYIFSKDPQVEILAMRIINKLKDIEVRPMMTMGEKLQRASELYLEENIHQNGLMVFNRPIVLGHHESEEDRVRHWFNEAIKAILKTSNNKEKSAVINIVNEKSNGKGLTIYKDAGGSFILKGILSPSVMIISPQDYSKLNEIVKEDSGVSIGELSCQEFYALQDQLARKQYQAQSLLPSLRSGVLPDHYKNLDKQQIKEQKKLISGLIKDEEKRRKLPKDNSSSTISVFDGIE